MGYIELKDLVDSGKLKLLLMLSTPRTRSTALQFTLTNASEVSGQINAPLSNDAYPQILFYHDNRTLIPGYDLRTFDNACDKIIEAAYEHMTSSDNSVTLLINEYFSRILDEEMEKLLMLTQNIVIPIREPVAQFASFLIQYFQKYLLASSCKGIKSRELLSLLSILEQGQAKDASNLLLLHEKISLDLVANILQKPTSDVIFPADYYSAYQHLINDVDCSLDILWTNLEFFLNNRLTFYRDSKNIIIIDTDQLMRNQEKMLQVALEKLEGISFSDTMFKWRKGCGNHYRTGHPKSSQTNQWSLGARGSTTLNGDNDSVERGHVLQDFPKKLSDTLKKAQVIYTGCCEQPELVRVSFSLQDELLLSSHHPGKMRANRVFYPDYSMLSRHAYFNTVEKPRNLGRVVHEESQLNTLSNTCR